jgi:putative transposase
VIDAAVAELEPVVGTTAACAAVGRSRATHYRHRDPKPPPQVVTERRRRAQPRALTGAEEAEVLQVLHSDRFCDESPATVYATLLDEGRYLASAATMYRLLRREHGDIVERRRQATHPPLSRPELVAEEPNDVWTWDITRLRGPGKRNFFYLYALLDLYSRYVPGWMLATVERGELARRLIAETIDKWGIDPTGLTIHSDRGVPAAKPVAQLLADLEITRSLTRPHTPDDNPYSESQFRTMKYRPAFPDHFEGFDDARGFCGRFFSWHNLEHRHSGIGFHTPASVYFGTAPEIAAQRAVVLDDAYARHPERFVAGRPRPPALPDAVYINPPTDDQEVIGTH